MKLYKNQEAKLLNHLIEGKELAFIHLMDTYHHRLCVYANSLINDDLLAEDIVQNVFIKLWNRRKTLGTTGSIKSFLYKSVYNEFIDQHRKRVSKLKVEEHYYKHLNNVVEQYDNDKIDNAIKQVYKVVQTLPPKCREIFMLSKSEGLTNIEIAEHLNISIKTVESQITKAFRTLRLKLKDKIKSVLFMLFNVSSI